MLAPYLGLGLLVPSLGPASTLPLLTLPLGLGLVRRFCREPVGPVFNTLLAATAGLQLVFGLLLAIAFVL